MWPARGLLRARGVVLKAPALSASPTAQAEELARCHKAYTAAARYFERALGGSSPEVEDAYLRIRFRAARAACESRWADVDAILQR